ncbi:hypothetical protein ES705_48389 [subsurface metagenome]
MEIVERRWATDLDTFKRYAQANYPFRRIVVLTDEDVLMIYEKRKSLSGEITDKLQISSYNTSYQVELN